jgi:transposase
MEAATSQPYTPAAIRTDLGAIFISLELARSTWLITSLSPGNEEKMSKHSVSGGDVGGLLGPLYPNPGEGSFPDRAGQRFRS